MEGDHAREIHTTLERKKIRWIVWIQREVSCKLGHGQGLTSDAEIAGITVYEEALLGIPRASSRGQVCFVV